MADALSLAQRHSDRTDSDAPVVMYFGCALLLILAAIVVALPFDLANGPQLPLDVLP